MKSYLDYLSAITGMEMNPLCTFRTSLPLNDRDSGNQWIQWLLDNRYDDGPVGLAGNDDGGALSAWAVFAMMGIYPIAGTTDYVLGQPTWDRVEIHDPRHPVVIQITQSVESIHVDGEEYENNVLSHEQLHILDFGKQ